MGIHAHVVMATHSSSSSSSSAANEDVETSLCPRRNDEFVAEYNSLTVELEHHLYYCHCCAYIFCQSFTVDDFLKH